MVEKRELVLGEEVKGKLEITSEEELDIESFGVTLYCEETVKKTRWVSEVDDEGRERRYERAYEDRRKLHSCPLRLCGEAHIPQGFSYAYPFSLKLPSYGRETYHSVDNNLVWGLSAMMDVRGRPPITSAGECEIIVAKPPEPPKEVMQKEVIREVVLIPCKYCGGLMPQTSVFCPNCSARRSVPAQNDANLRSISEEHPERRQERPQVQVQSTPLQTPVYSCPNCGYYPVRFIKEYSRWYCDRCHRYA
jgi:ribosomal protein S27AE